jgi:choline dehydrogenase-like flavoprotein
VYRSCFLQNIIVENHYKVIIVGSGVAGVHAALPLVEAGISVAMIDGGNTAPKILEEPVDDFITMRTSRYDQWRWFLGEDYSNIALQGIRGAYGGGMVGGNKEYVVKNSSEELPLKTDRETAIVQSVACGGLAAAWGAACTEYDAETLQALGLNVHNIQEEYAELRSFIGISGTESYMQSPLQLDNNAQVMLRSAKKHPAWFAKKSVKIVQPSSAVLTEPLDNRRPTQYSDMDYYSDYGRSIYRPQWTLEYLQTFPNFTYISPYIVTRLIPNTDFIRIITRNRTTNVEQEYTADYSVLAAGAIGTARIVLQSFGTDGDTLPLFAKTHAFIVGIQCNSYRKYASTQRTSLCQLVMVDTHKKIASFCAQIYSYRSLLVFRLLTSIPFALRQTFYFMSVILPRIILVDVRFSHEYPQSSIEYRHNTVHVTTSVDYEVKKERKLSMKTCVQALRKCGVLPIKKFFQSEGTASHYAGTLPINDESQKFFTTQQFSVNIDKRIYIADSSSFKILPALPQTFTIMAYARSVGKYLARQIL